MANVMEEENKWTTTNTINQVAAEECMEGKDNTNLADGFDQGKIMALGYGIGGQFYRTNEWINN